MHPIFPFLANLTKMLNVRFLTKTTTQTLLFCLFAVNFNTLYYLFYYLVLFLMIFKDIKELFSIKKAQLCECLTFELAFINSREDKLTLP